MVRQVHGALTRKQPGTRDTQRFLLRHLSEPKAQVVFARPPRPASAAQFRQTSVRRGVALHPATRMLYAGRECGINGDSLSFPAQCARQLRTLADERALDAATLATLPDVGHALLHAWYEAGWIQLVNEGTAR